MKQISDCPSLQPFAKHEKASLLLWSLFTSSEGYPIFEHHPNNEICIGRQDKITIRSSVIEIWPWRLDTCAPCIVLMEDIFLLGQTQTLKRCNRLTDHFPILFSFFSVLKHCLQDWMKHTLWPASATICLSKPIASIVAGTLCVCVCIMCLCCLCVWCVLSLSIISICIITPCNCSIFFRV